MNKITSKLRGNRFIPSDKEELSALELIKKVVNKVNEGVNKINEYDINIKDNNDKVNNFDKKIEKYIKLVDELPKTNAVAEVVEARKGEKTLGDKINTIDEQLEHIVTYFIEEINGFDENDISIAINKIVPLLNEGDTLLIPNKKYKFKNTMYFTSLKNGVTIDIKGELIQDGNMIDAIVLNGAYYNFNINKLTGIIPNGDFSNLITNGIKIGTNNSFQGNININILSGFKNGIYCNPTLRGVTPNGIQYNKINFNILDKCECCIKFDLIKGEGWVNENTFVGGSVNGKHGIQLINGNDNPATGYNNNKFYNVGFEGIQDNTIELNNSNGNSFINCRILEANEGEYYIKEVSNCNWNLFIFSGLLPYEKLLINGSLDRIIAPLSINGAWISNGFHVSRGIKYFETSLDYIAQSKVEERTLPLNTGIVEINSYDTPITLIIPDNFKQQGKELTLRVSSYKNSITLKNENGSIIDNSTISENGVWKIYYMNTNWKIYKADYYKKQMEPLYSSANTIDTLATDFKTLLGYLRNVGLMKS